MVYRIFVEKKPGLDSEASALLSDIRNFLAIRSLEKLRVFNRYDVENCDADLFEYGKRTVFSEPQLDNLFDAVPDDGGYCFAVEYLPGQFDQRADSAAQCLQMLSRGARPEVKTAKVYLLYGSLSNGEIAEIKKYVINPVEAREASLLPAETLARDYTVPRTVETLTGFTAMGCEEIGKFAAGYSLAMDESDLEFCRDYFRSEHRDPTITEIRVIDTYWSDHCRHTTFLTNIDSVSFSDPMLQTVYDEYLKVRELTGQTKPVTLMDIATVAARYLKQTGQLRRLDESDEINACTVKIDVETDGGTEPWLLLFKNETHNHPTEIEPFGGAATCIGGAIRDPLSGRAYVYAAMRVTGAANPLQSVSETVPGKLPQRKIVTTAAAGYSSYGNQIGLATGIVDEIYHPGYAAKRMEIGAVIGAVPEKNVRREAPLPGDKVILLGGRTGRDGCGGATGSSKSHTIRSLEECGAEVQKGNAPEERKLQRLFRNPEVCRLIKRCNDFGAGGVSVAIGELADGLKIDLNAVPKKYEGLDGTELAISESQERMAVVVSPGDAARFAELAAGENLEATVVAEVQSDPRLQMYWNGKLIVDLSREFLNSNGAEKHTEVCAAPAADYRIGPHGGFCDLYRALAGDLNICSKQGLSERFDSTIGAGTVLMPFGGKYQATPIQAMAHKIPVENRRTNDCSLMAWGYNPRIAEKSPYHGAYLAVVESVSKLIAGGGGQREIYLTFQEYFAKPNRDPARWGVPFSALLGAFKAQTELGIGAVGGKDSMSGSFEDLDVPPTLVSFAVTSGKAGNVISPEFKKAGSRVAVISPKYGENLLPETDSLKRTFETVAALLRSGKAVSAYTPGEGGIAGAVLKMCLGNRIGFAFVKDFPIARIFEYAYGSFVLELADDCDTGETLGYTLPEFEITRGDERVGLNELSEIYENKLEKVYRREGEKPVFAAETFTFNQKAFRFPAVRTAKPHVLIPVFPGTNCEYDSAAAMSDAGAEPEIFVINNLTAEGVARSVETFAKKLSVSQMVFIPGGFSGGDEPDGSGKFITAFFRNAEIKEQVEELLEKRDGLMLGICNGFQALIKLGLVPYGKIIDTDETCPTLTYNTVGRHQSKIVRVRVASSLSPWLAGTRVGEVYSVPVSHGEGRFYAGENLIRELANNGQIATQYVDFDGRATDDIRFNPNQSLFAVEGITSPDGRVFGKMGHCERKGPYLYKNVPGNYDMRIFESGVRYFR